jgi:CheY-like chemotaxis protein
MEDALFTLLLFEDDDNDAFLLQRALKKVGIENPVHRVRDGQEGIEYLTGVGQYGDRSRFPFPRVVLLDLKMPRKSGLEVLQWMKTHPEYKVIPTIIFTASREHQDIATSYGLGANCFVAKPSRFEDLEHLVRILHEFWRLCEKPGQKAAGHDDV